ncbi:MAG: hypothetical protein IJ945_08065 [Oscillospiraceae bacterium]|nr:hypothetical protein [Oscillospiraceae bacterium]
MKTVEKYKDISNVDELLEYLRQKGTNHKCYYHYTSWDSFSKIYNGASFLLTRGNSLSINDQHEAMMKGSWQEWNKTYIGSFAFGAAENMAMWGLYGLPWEDAVRISIPKKAMLKWIDGIEKVYLWDGEPKETITAEISLADIVYVSGEAGGRNLQLTHRDAVFSTKNKINLFGVDTNSRMTGYIKNYAWRYENEVRLHVRLPHSTGAEKIMIKIPEEVLEDLTITTGPSFLYKGDNLYRKLQEEGRLVPSGFENLVRYRPLCSMCQNGPFSKAL